MNDNKKTKTKTKTRCDIFADELVIWKVLGRRWALSILKNLDTKEAIRFNELKRLMPGISSTVLAERLSQLVRGALFQRRYGGEVIIRHRED
jgi:DNA-binding HxlR family transcriptional regulator